MLLYSIHLQIRYSGHIREILGLDYPALLQDVDRSRHRDLGPGPGPGRQPPRHGRVGRRDKDLED